LLVVVDRVSREVVTSLEGELVLRLLEPALLGVLGVLLLLGVHLEPLVLHALIGECQGVA
jgi:hypothetical protein